MREAGRPMKPREIVKAVADHGWIDPEAKTPEQAIRLTTRRLRDDGELELLPGGFYRFAPSSGVPDEHEPQEALEVFGD